MKDNFKKIIDKQNKAFRGFTVATCETLLLLIGAAFGYDWLSINNLLTAYFILFLLVLSNMIYHFFSWQKCDSDLIFSDCHNND